MITCAHEQTCSYDVWLKFGQSLFLEAAAINPSHNYTSKCYTIALISTNVPRSSTQGWEACLFLTASENETLPPRR